MVLVEYLEHIEYQQSVTFYTREQSPEDWAGAQKPSQVPSKIEALIAELTHQPADFNVTWVFDGTMHFVDQNKKLARYRAWLKQLFDALESKNRDSMLKALQEARQKFRKGRVGFKSGMS